MVREGFPQPRRSRRKALSPMLDSLVLGALRVCNVADQTVREEVSGVRSSVGKWGHVHEGTGG